MKTNLLFAAFIGFISFSNGVHSQVDTTLLQNNIPAWVLPVLEKSEIAQKHQLLTPFNPFYFEADFTGDNMVDIAFYVENKIDKTKGVMIINNGKNLVYVIGCGTATDMGSSLSWAKRWFIYRNRYIMNGGNKNKITLKYPAIQVIRSETKSLVIYWNGKKYKTFIQES
ncbi:hypothetical protein [Fluviicola taffensis]|uniref:Secreted protein n=1 Tax=Fluviicola taffensis (strain DSM 16823 / NCIMB 13979 / RW262) TaxID=755732 RepID=F2IJ56_FLUTR|nr:hypothetical protein [Fluviicola taffensis]AEA44926.1 hypothetical protein Fluta_2947 [Fluviicola taffensis DSM 16823]